MEYIEGRELREMTDTKVENLRKVVDYATQIAAGLQAGHLSLHHTNIATIYAIEVVNFAQA